ncbi:dUTP diphosphatase [Gemmatimonadota bacterium]
MTVDRNEQVQVELMWLDDLATQPLPAYESAGSAGMDIRAHLDEPVTIESGGTALIPTGFALALPIGYEAQIRPRSGLALRNAISLPNSPGTVDSDYRGEVKIILINHSTEPFIVEEGMRIAQMVISPVCRATIAEVPELPETSRGAGGFGSTGH